MNMRMVMGLFVSTAVTLAVIAVLNRIPFTRELTQAALR